jgi:hypothetical protein
MIGDPTTKAQSPGRAGNPPRRSRVKGMRLADGMKNTLGALLILTGGLAAGCLVDIHHVDNPRPEFARARAEAARVEGLAGPAHTLCVLAWDRGDHELTRVSVPFWLLRKIAKGEDAGIDLGGEVDDKLREHLSRLRLEDLQKAGLGTLVEVEEDDGDQVLVWLR